MSDNNLFGGADVISTYSRRQAIEDGVLVQLSGPGYQGESWVPAMCAEAGFKFPIAVTSEVFHECIALTPKASEMLNDMQGRLWDVLGMLRYAIRKQPADASELLFKVYIVRNRRKPDCVTLKSVCGPGDDGSPVLTIMYPEQS